MSDGWVWLAYMVTYGLIGGYTALLYRRWRKTSSRKAKNSLPVHSDDYRAELPS